MKCKHPPDHVVTKYDTTGIPEPYELEFRECLDCGTWLSIGPSNDSNVVEIRAAERAAEWRDLGYAPTGYDRFEWCPDMQGDRLCERCDVLFLARHIVGTDGGVE